MAIITVPRVLREKLGEDGADALVGLINEADGQPRSEKKRGDRDDTEARGRFRGHLS